MEQDLLSSTEAVVRRTVMDVIEYGSVYDVEMLDKLYSDNMKIVRVSADGQTNVLGKRDVLNFFQAMRTRGAEPLSTQAEFNHIEAGDEMAQVVVTRTMRLFGKLEKSVYNLCLAKKEHGWTVVKETVVAVA